MRWDSFDISLGSDLSRRPVDSEHGIEGCWREQCTEKKEWIGLIWSGDLK